MDDFGSAARHGGAIAARTVLLVIGDAWLRDAISAGLRAAGCLPVIAQDIAEAERIAASLVPDALILDLDVEPERASRLPAAIGAPAGVERIPTALLSSLPPDPEGTPDPWAAQALWVTKPVHPRELVQALLRLMRRQREPRTPRQPLRTRPVVLGRLEVSTASPVIAIRRGEGADQEFSLPRREHGLLLALIEPPIRVRTRDELRRAVWGESPVALRTVDQYVKRLRLSLAAAGLQDFIRTLNTAGYRAEPRALESLAAAAASPAAISSAVPTALPSPIAEFEPGCHRTFMDAS